MTWHFPIYTPIFILNVALSLWLALLVWQRRSVPGVRVFAVMLVASALWSFTRMLEAGFDEIGTKIFWGKTEYFGSLVIAPAWFVFTCYYTHQLKRFPHRYIVLLAIIPLITLFLTWTNESHHLIWTTITRSPTNPEVLNYGHGLAFWITVINTYVLLMAGVWNLIAALRHLPKKYQTQARFLLLGSFAPIAGNVLYLAGLSPIKGMDITPFCLTITAIIYFLTVFRFRLFDIRHVARTTIIENMRDGMLIIDEKYEIVDVNPSALRLLGLSKTVMAKDIRLVLTKFPTLLTAINNHQTQTVTVLIEDSRSLYIDVQISEIEDALGNTAGKLIVLRDVTERHLSEKRAFENAIEQHRIQLLKQFISNLSHEYRTPLAIINTSAYLMEKKDDTEQRKKHREMILRQTQLLETLIRETMTIVQLDTGIPLEYTLVNLSTLLQSLTQEQLSIFNTKQQQLNVQIPETSVQITGDSLMLRKALSNILLNAHRYTPEGGTISAVLKRQDDFATITISDTGVGVSAEHQERIFERFFRVDDAHSTPGFGLGLPIAQSIIEKHKGWIDIESNIGSGTIFTVWLPHKIDEPIPQPLLQLAPT